MTGWKFNFDLMKQRFENFLMSIPECGCSIWMGSLSDKGYGRFTIKKKVYLAHRISWEIYYGKIPHKLYVLHHCDTPSCCNPHHLFLGTQLDNITDMVQKNRHKNNTKLTEEQVIKILSDKRSCPEIAKEYGLHRSAIYHLKAGYNWTKITKGKKSFVNPPINANPKKQIKWKHWREIENMRKPPSQI